VIGYNTAMRRSRFDHKLDWKGLRFALMVLFGALVLGSAVHSGTERLLVAMYSPGHSGGTTIVDALNLAEYAEAAELSTTTPERVINALTIKDAIPKEGKFIAADLVAMQLYLYQDGTLMEQYPIKTKGRPGTPWETPGGVYAIQTKEKNHFSSIGKVYMPYSMQFYGNYFIHGWTYYPDGSPTSATFSGGCIKLETEDAKNVFAFADVGTQVFVYDNKQTVAKNSIALQRGAVPQVTSQSYVVADIDTGDVLIERNADTPQPIASITKLMTALVANETISLDKEMNVSRGVLMHPQDPADATTKRFLVDDLFYPLLMESNNAIADRLAGYYGTHSFVNWMNLTAKALDMQSTHFTDPTGVSEENTSTADDLFRLVTYLYNKKSFVLKITRTPTKQIKATDASVFSFSNYNEFSGSDTFIGGKVGRTTAAGDTMVSAFTIPVGSEQRHIAIIVLQSKSYADDTSALLNWVMSASQPQTPACAQCAQPPEYRKIEI
jgi:D-alanyl-D-alanine endopeptidase (penicillin-binding protein 7)